MDEAPALVPLDEAPALERRDAGLEPLALRGEEPVSELRDGRELA